MTKHNTIFTTLLLIIAMLVWASSFIALKIAVNDMGMMSVIFFRMLVASLFFVFFIKKFINLEFTKRNIKLLLIMVFFEPCMYFIFEINALTYTTAGQAGVITSFMPLITAFAAGVFLSEIIRKEMIIGSVIAIIGAVWLSLISNSAENASNPLLGNFLEMLAMVCGAGYTIVLRHLVKDFSPLFLTAIQSFAGTLFFLPLTVFEYMTSTSTTLFSLDSVLAVIYLGSVVTLGGYGLYNYAVSRTTAANASSFINLIPVFTLIIAFLVLDEVLDYEQLLACSLILLGVVITQTKFLKPKRDTTF